MSPCSCRESIAAKLSAPSQPEHSRDRRFRAPFGHWHGAATIAKLRSLVLERKDANSEGSDAAFHTRKYSADAASTRYH